MATPEQNEEDHNHRAAALAKRSIGTGRRVCFHDIGHRPGITQVLARSLASPREMSCYINRYAWLCLHYVRNVLIW